MRSYVIDELEEEDIEKLYVLLNALNLQSSVEGIFWLPVPNNLLSDKQKEHVASCGPYVMSLDMESYGIRLEFLVRAKNAMHCQCTAYASPELEQYMMRYVENLLEQVSVYI